MTDLLSGLVALDRLAASRGDGLKPALAALLRGPRDDDRGAAQGRAAEVVDLGTWRRPRPSAAPRCGRIAR